MKYLVDMGISPKAVLFLKSLGHEAVHLQELHLDHLTDPEIMKKARNEGMVILTHDLDFSELVANSGDSLPSVIVFRLRNMRPENVSRYLEIVATEYENDLTKGAIISVTEGKIRVRSIPFEIK